MEEVHAIHGEQRNRIVFMPRVAKYVMHVAYVCLNKNLLCHSCMARTL